jgi:sugar (pentulose or hexulose) kinase
MDTWGNDYALLGEKDALLENPFHYRDSRTGGMIERVCNVVPREEIYSQSGIQFMELNGLCQLYASFQKTPKLYPLAERLLTIPDLLNFWLTGEARCEFNNAANLHKHTRHPLNSEGSECVSCHMPRIMNALMLRARTHRIDDIPNARMTEQFGPRQSPNACLLCHGDKNVAWLKQGLETKWNVHKTLVSTSGR